MTTAQVETCRLAFEERQPDALDRAVKLRNDLATGIGKMRILGRLKGRRHGRASVAIPPEVSEAMRELHAVTGLIDEFGQRNLKDDQFGPTTELLAQIRNGKGGDPFVRLHVIGKVSSDHVRYSREIAGIVYSITKRQHAKVGQMPTASDGGPAGERARKYTAAESAEWTALLHSLVYLPWADRVKGDIAMILGMAVDGESLRQAARSRGVGERAALRRITDALDWYGAIRLGFINGRPGLERVVPIGVSKTNPNNRAQ